MVDKLKDRQKILKSLFFYGICPENHRFEGFFIKKIKKMKY